MKFFKILVCSFSLLFSNAVFAQHLFEDKVLQEYCIDFAPPPFVGNPEPTLCEQYYNLSGPIGVGEFTFYPTSSSLGSNFSGSVNILGNFIIDTPLEFKDAIIRVNPGIGIFIKGGNTLTINNSKLFSGNCDELWAGITMESNTNIITKNGSVIEDAVKTIDASNTFWVTFDCSNTTFNRNYENIYLDNSVLQTPHTPSFLNFSNNTFSCTSPLNGTIFGTANDWTRSGIHMNDCPVYLPSKEKNTFTGIYSGIRAFKNSFIHGGKLKFTNNKSYGIFSEYGLIQLNDCEFLNNNTNIKIIDLNSVDLEGCKFNLNNKFIGNDPNGIIIDNINDASHLSIDNCSFSFNNKIEKIWYQHILSKGLKIGSSSKINISNSTFTSIIAYQQQQKFTFIRILGGFPEESSIDIYNNKFTFVTSDSKAKQSSYISTGGDMNNMHIYGNNFRTNSISAANYVHNGILDLAGSSGKNNKISDNTFTDTDGIIFANFKNSTFCSNKFYASTIGLTALSAIGNCEKTQLIANQSFRPELLNIGTASFIDKQVHNGNIWSCVGNGCGFFFSNKFLVTADPTFIKLSPIKVHTIQSISLEPSDPGFEPYFPALISPAPTGDWWETDGSGSPKAQSNCLDKFTDDDDNSVYRRVADGSIADIVKAPIQLWETRKTLFFELMDNSDLLTSNNIYSKFLDNSKNTNIAVLYKVSNGIKSAKNISFTKLAEIKNIQNEITEKISELRVLDNLLLEETEQSKINLINLEKEKLNSNLYILTKSLEKINNEISVEVATKSAELIGLNKGFTPNNLAETNEQIVNHYTIKVLLGQPLSEQELIELYNIAIQCPRDGGSPVYIARNMIPDCLTKDIDDFDGYCYPKQERDTTIVVPDEIDISKVLKNTFNNSQTFIYPNPSNGLLTIKAPNTEKGRLIVINSLGQTVFKKDFLNGESLVLTELSNGVYWANIYINGQQTVERLIIAK